VVIPQYQLDEDFAPSETFCSNRMKMIGNNDLWIAAHALAAGLTLVTNSEKEFRRVRGLKVQNWSAPRTDRLSSS
jgi:tRNA(fMet)-specific endonuclease VapC